MSPPPAADRRSGYCLGLDLGSVSLKCIVLDPYGRIVFKRYARTAGRPLTATLTVLKALAAQLGATVFSGVVATGSGKELIAGAVEIETVNEIVAQAKAAWVEHPQVRSVIEIGGQDSKFIVIGRSPDGIPFIQDHAFNELCAAGTGAFLDQQAQRLGVSVERLGTMARDAARSVRLAGRCSVFAKSDMIHFQQQAVPADEIAAGLCTALARTYLANLCRGQPPAPPVLFQGGVAANQGVVRAFRDLLALGAGELIVPAHFEVTGALGAALLAGEKPLRAPQTAEGLIAALGAESAPAGMESGHPPLAHRPAAVRAPASRPRFTENRCVMGIDVGSVSTKAVLVGADHNLLASAYLPTAGNAVEAIRMAIAKLGICLPDEARVSHVAATGSGRHLVRVLLNGGTVLDEISAQAVAAAFFFPEADTIIEIGGQDSKYIRLAQGKVLEFRMNRACAAGTGAFLEEQAGRLGVDITEAFAEAAFDAPAPVRLGSRCTVFMDSDLVHHLQRGASTRDLCAGLAYAVGQNYLEKVVGSAPVGSKVVFQGGVARNRAVHAVFENLLGREVLRHPHPEISGALGAAFTALLALSTGNAGHALSLSRLRIGGVSKIFACRRCENGCEIRKLTGGNGGAAYLGGICGRFEHAAPATAPAPDAFALRERLLRAGVRRAASPDSTRRAIGLPMTLTLSDYLPFWGCFFERLGFATVTSNPTDRRIAAEGLKRVPAEFCHPIKILFGHVHHLIEKGVHRIFIPHLRLFTPPGETEPRYACPYTQAAPYVIRGNVPDGIEILTLEYPVDGESLAWLEAAAEALGIERHAVEAAYAAAGAAQQAFREECRAAGAGLLRDLEKGGRRGAVLLGRPYNTSDRHLNLNLAARLKALDIEPVPFDFLPLGEEKLPPLWNRIRWGYGRKLVQAARFLKQHPHLGAVILTNFGCGPDAFVDQYLEYELKEIPHVLIELDDHQAEAGVLTRLEAFNRNFKIRRFRPPAVTGKDPGEPRRPLREYTYYIPSFMDQAYAITGALKASGCRTVLLPPTDERSWNLGLKHAYGRECHPFIAFTGDLLKAAERPDFEPEAACYFGPSYFGPCLLPQYPLALHLILEKAGLAGVTVMNITDASNMRELGSAYMVRLALGLYAIDRMCKWKTEIALQAAEKGEVERVYREVLIDLEHGLAEGSFFRALKRAVTRFTAIPLSPDGNDRPRIGIVGDIYTRINAHSNDRLYERLNAMGFDVWTSSSLIDVSFLGMEQRHAELDRQGKPARAAAAKMLIPALRAARRLVDRYFPRDIQTPQERQYPDVHRASSRYVSFWIDRVLSLNLNRIEELHQAGVDGIINVMCHNCMLGTITAALSKIIRGDIADTPLCSLVYEGLKSTHNVNRLEAFTDQVRSFRSARARGTASPRP